MANRRLHRTIDVPVRKKSKLKPIVITICSVLLLCLCLVGLFAGQVYHKARTTVNRMNVHAERVHQNEIDKLIQNHKPINILLLGTDTGDLGRHDTGRTDTMMIATINPDTKQVLLTSIARDTMTIIPGFKKQGIQKINNAYNLGGIPTSIKTVEQYLHIKINGYALVNMGGLIKTVNEVGGVQVVSPLSFTFCPQNSQTYGKEMYHFTQGQSAYQVSFDDGKTWETKQTMTGNAALAFSRMRDQDPQGDYGRQQRQRLLIKALMKKSISPKTLNDQVFMDKIADNVRTDLSFDDVITLLTQYHIDGSKIQTNYLHGQLDQVNGIDYQSSTPEEKQAVQQQIQQMLRPQSSSSSERSEVSEE